MSRSLLSALTRLDKWLDSQKAEPVDPVPQRSLDHWAMLAEMQAQGEICMFYNKSKYGESMSAKLELENGTAKLELSERQKTNDFRVVIEGLYQQFLRAKRLYIQ